MDSLPFDKGLKILLLKLPIDVTQKIITNNHITNMFRDVTFDCVGTRLKCHHFREDVKTFVDLEFDIVDFVKDECVGCESESSRTILIKNILLTVHFGKLDTPPLVYSTFEEQTTDIVKIIIHDESVVLSGNIYLGYGVSNYTDLLNSLNYFS